MFMKTRRLIIDGQSKKKPLMNNRKKQKTEHSSDLNGSGGYGRKLGIQNADSVVKKDKKLISGSSKEGVLYTGKSKRKLSSILRKALRRRKKRKMETGGKIDEVVEPVDRISELPEPIIHNILSLLRCPKDLTRTTVWSKRWRSIWASFFSFDFDQKKFKTSEGKHVEKFITFVEGSLATKLESMHSVQKFKITLAKASFKLISPMNSWINAAINKDVKELEIHAEESSLKRHYLLPNIVLASKNLTSLKLYGCKLDNNVNINLCNLKELSIKNARVNADVINNFTQGCPLLEDLRLINCKRVGHLHISTLHKLRTVQLHECHGLVSVNIESNSLVSFLLWLKMSWGCCLSLAGSENMKHLSIKDPNLTDTSFQDLMVKFPNLENIVLRECNSLEQITILSKTLKGLSVIRCKRLKDPLIDAPNLSSFEYTGQKMPFPLRHISVMQEAKLHLQIRKKSPVNFCEFGVFLQNFRKSEAWKMVVSSCKDITIYEELPKNQAIPSNEFKMELFKSPMKLKDFVSNLLRMSRPKTLTFVSTSSSELLNFLKEKILSREKNPVCCTYYGRKCWLHHIKDVTMVELPKGAELGDTSHNLQRATFVFTWQSEQLALEDGLNDSLNIIYG